MRRTCAIAELREHKPDERDPASVKLADAQHMLARSYRASSWTRLVQAVELADAIWRDDVDAVRVLVTRNPKLIHEDVLVRADSNWGAPMTYAANLGRDAIIRLLHSLGATDFERRLVAQRCREGWHREPGVRTRGRPPIPTAHWMGRHTRSALKAPLHSSRSVRP